MTINPFSYEARPAAGVETLEDELFIAFTAIRGALSQHRPVVVVVRDEDLLGHGAPVDAALAGGLVGLTRALATEGARVGWQINAIAVTADVSKEDRATWVKRLSATAGVNGEVIRLGALHLGRVSV